MGKTLSKRDNGDGKIQGREGSEVTICGLIPSKAANPCNGQEVNLVAQSRRKPVENIDQSPSGNTTEIIVNLFPPNEHNRKH